MRNSQIQYLWEGYPCLFNGKILVMSSHFFIIRVFPQIVETKRAACRP